MKKTRPSHEDTFQLLDISYDEDEDESLIAKIKRTNDGKVFEMTLDYLESEDKESINNGLLDLYAVWYVNWQ